MEFGSKPALARALENVESKYEVVGILEELESTVRSLEMRIPQFFHGAGNALRKVHKSKKIVLNMSILREFALCRSTQGPQQSHAVRRGLGQIEEQTRA